MGKIISRFNTSQLFNEFLKRGAIPISKLHDWAYCPWDVAMSYWWPPDVHEAVAKEGIVTHEKLDVSNKMELEEEGVEFVQIDKDELTLSSWHNAIVNEINLTFMLSKEVRKIFVYYPSTPPL